VCAFILESIEDMLGRRFYTALVNECYELKDKNKLKTRKSSSTPDRVILEVENHFKKISVKFDHYTPAMFLMMDENLINDLPGGKTALDFFESLFNKLNNFILK
jgi:hypothetical protein